MSVLESPRPVTHNCGSLLSSKRMRCLALAAAIFVVAASPAAAQDPDPLPAPTAPGARSRTAGARSEEGCPRPAPVKQPGRETRARSCARYALGRARGRRARTTDSAAPLGSGACQESRTQEPVVVVKPAEPLRHLPIRDATAPRVEETALILTAARFGEDDGGVGAIGLVAAFWLALAAALLLVAYVAPFADVPQPLGVFLYERRSVLALIAREHGRRCGHLLPRRRDRVSR